MVDSLTNATVSTVGNAMVNTSFYSGEWNRFTMANAMVVVDSWDLLPLEPRIVAWDLH